MRRKPPNNGQPADVDAIPLFSGGKTPEELVSYKSGFGGGDSGLRGLPEGRFGADDAPREKIILGWNEMDV